MIKLWKFGVMLTLLGVVACGGGSSGEKDVFSQTPSPTIKYADLQILSGDNQVGLIGEQLPQPLTVGVYDNQGNPVKATVTFSIISGSASLSAIQVQTTNEGKASVTLRINGDVEEIKIKASVEDVGNVVFTAIPRLPTLYEVLGGSVEQEEVALLPAIITRLDNGEDVLVLLRGKNPSIDLTKLPVAAELAGGTVDGVPLLDFPVVFVSAGALIVPENTNLLPLTGYLSSRFLGGAPVENSYVVTKLRVNGSPAVVGILGGDATGEAITTLGELLRSAAKIEYEGDTIPIAELPLYFVDSEFFPADPSADNYSYAVLQAVSVPIFSVIEMVNGASSNWVGVVPFQIPTTTTHLMSLSGGLVSFGLQLYNVPALLEEAVPKGALTPLPVELLDIFNIVKSDIAPLLAESQPQLDEIAQLLHEISDIAQENSDLLMEILQGGITNPLQLAGIATQVLPVFDQIVGNSLLVLPNIEQLLSKVEDELLPAILDILPEDGGVFGGYSDGNPSTIAYDLIPTLQAHIDNLQSAIPFVQSLLEDIEDIIPDDGNIYTLMFNLFNGGLAEIADDLKALIPYIVEGLEILYQQDIPILFDILEEAEENYPAGDSPLSETVLFQILVSNLTAMFPPGTKLGDIPALQDILSVIDELFPDEYGNPADWDIYDDIIPMLGSVDIGSDILPVLREALENLNSAIPEIISEVENFDFWDLISLPFIQQ